MLRADIHAVVILSAATLSAGAAPAAAEEAGASAAVVVVTAERRPQNQGDVLGNVALIDRAEVELVGPQVASEVLNRAPGVAVHRNNGVENLPAIRSPVLTGGQSAGSFLILEDGVPIRASGFGNVNQLFETSLDFAHQVEVVRGPGSALYGSNAVHGVVHVVTQNGPDGAFDAQIDADTFGRAHAQVLANLARWSTGGVYAGVAARHDDGWRDDASTDQQNILLGARGRIGLWDFDAKLASQNLNQETAGFIEGTNAYKDRARARTNPTPEAYRDAQLTRARVTAERDIGADMRVSVTGYARRVVGDLSISFLPSRAQELTRQHGAGLQSALYWDASERLSFIFGADAESGAASLYEFQSRATTGAYPQGLHYNYDVDYASAAAFAQARWEIAPDWRLVAGLRGEAVSYDYVNHAGLNDVGRFRRPADREDDFDAVTPKLGVIWSPAADQSLWLNLTRGARPPQVTDLYSLQTTQIPGGQGVEKMDSVELGWRGRLGPAQLEATLYHMDKTDTSFRNADGFTVTGAATSHQGVEVSADWPLTKTIALAGWVTYARHSYEFDNPSTRAGESIRAGDDVDGAPRWIWNGRLKWRPFERVETEFEWVHMGEYFTNAANTRTYPGHDVVNLRAEWTSESGLALFTTIRNLGDVAYAERADFAFGNDRYFPGEPIGATFGVRMRR